jgi:hypothetical protein
MTTSLSDSRLAAHQAQDACSVVTAISIHGGRVDHEGFPNADIVCRIPAATKRAAQ